MANQGLTIGALARQAGVNVETIRYYHRRGLLPEPRKPAGSVRYYSGSDVGRIHFIKSAQRLGFTLGEIALLLKLEDGTHCVEAREIAERKLVAVRGKLADLQRIEAVLARLVCECATSRGSVCCPLIDSLQRTSVSAG